MHSGSDPVPATEYMLSISPHQPPQVAIITPLTGGKSEISKGEVTVTQLVGDKDRTKT